MRDTFHLGHAAERERERESEKTAQRVKRNKRGV